MYYQGKFKPKNLQKYKGDPTDICYRSSWELATFIWLDQEPGIVEWASESVVIPYYLKPELVESILGPGLKTDGKAHRYYIDLFVKFANGNKLLVEIKPERQTKPPKIQKRKTKKYLGEWLVYIQNRSKWEAAEKWACERGMIFEVWTENKLRNLGVRILSGG